MPLVLTDGLWLTQVLSEAGPGSVSRTGEDTFDAWAFGASGGTGSDLLVRFEISIVKVGSKTEARFRESS